MKNVIILILLGILVAGCPYHSDVPLSGFTLEVNPYVLGSWVSCDSQGNCKYLDVQKESDYTYSFVYKTYNREKNTWSVREKTCHTTNVGGTLFINMEVSPDKYNILKCEISRSELRLSTVNILNFMVDSNSDGKEELMSFNNSIDFCNYVNFMKNKKDFYNGTEVFKRNS